jgi:uncharacterized protein YjbJ (UPF0337 family)
MNRDILQGKWNQLRGEVIRQWGRLTNDDVDELEGNFEKLVGRIQERYGYQRERAEQEVDDFLARWSPSPA